MEFHMLYIIYAALHMRNAHTNRKDDIFMQRRLYIDEAHTALDIFRFAVFFFYICKKRASLGALRMITTCLPKARDGHHMSHNDIVR